MTYASRLALDSTIRTAVLPILQARLSDTLDLQSQAKQAHWNVKGANFISLHELFDRIADDLASAADDIAERIVALGGYADGRIATTARDTGLPQWPEHSQMQSDVLRALAASISSYARCLRDAVDRTAEIGDAGTADLFTGQSRQSDKHLWLLEAHLIGMQGY
jgi:starvation-inducible DNA-binding protein